MSDIKKPQIIDCIRGRQGTLIEKKPNGDRFDIIFQPLDDWNPAHRQEIQYVPVGGIKEIHLKDLETNYEWWFVVNDGSDRKSPILEALNIQMTESITAAEDTERMSDLRDRVATSREKIAVSKSADKAKELFELLNVNKKKRDINIPIDIIDEGG